LLRKEKAYYADVITHVKGFEEGIVECKTESFTKFQIKTLRIIAFLNSSHTSYCQQNISNNKLQRIERNSW